MSAYLEVDKTGQIKHISSPDCTKLHASNIFLDGGGWGRGVWGEWMGGDTTGPTYFFCEKWVWLLTSLSLETFFIWIQLVRTPQSSTQNMFCWLSLIIPSNLNCLIFQLCTSHKKKKKEYVWCLCIWRQISLEPQHSVWFSWPLWNHVCGLVSDIHHSERHEEERVKHRSVWLLRLVSLLLNPPAPCQRFFTLSTAASCCSAIVAWFQNHFTISEWSHDFRTVTWFWNCHTPWLASVCEQLHT